MSYLSVSQLPIVEEQNADREVEPIFAQIRNELEIPFVPNFFKMTAAGSLPVLVGTWEVFRQVYLQSSLPMALKALILFAVASDNQCEYCSAIHQATCKNVGIDEDTLMAVAGELENLTPRRIQAIVRFALKCAHDARNLTEADYEQVREQGISNEELIEIIALAALANYLDTLADATKVDIDSAFAHFLKD
jgi:uncharacterized peroxidase-related enzyme